MCKCKSLDRFFSTPRHSLFLLLVLYGYYSVDENVPRLLCFETPCHICTHIVQCRRQKHDWWDVLLANSVGGWGGVQNSGVLREWNDPSNLKQRSSQREVCLMQWSVDVYVYCKADQHGCCSLWHYQPDAGCWHTDHSVSPSACRCRVIASSGSKPSSSTCFKNLINEYEFTTYVTYPSVVFSC